MSAICDNPACTATHTTRQHEYSNSESKATTHLCDACDAAVRLTVGPLMKMMRLAEQRKQTLLMDADDILVGDAADLLRYVLDKRKLVTAAPGAHGGH